MATRIEVSELRVGMYIGKLGVSWLNHPFVRGSFLLTDAKDIQTILDAGITEVWIDEEKSIPEAAPEPARPSLAPETKPQAKPVNPPRAAPVAASMAEEMERARRICQSAKAQVVSMFQDARLGKAVDPETTLELVGEISASVQRHPGAFVSIARLKTHDDYTYLHSVAVCSLMLALAHQLNLEESITRIAGLAGLMHDLGKAAMPLEILNKPGKLTDAEFAVMRSHPAKGAQMLREGGAGPEVVDVALHHHEKVDGTGYPDRLSGDAISLLARMGAVCDVYDAVTSNRSYKKAWDPSKTMHEMAQWQGHFDKVVFNAFVKAVGIYPVGSLVRLQSRRLAVVSEPGKESLLTPKVRAFYSLRSKERIALQTIDLAEADCKDAIAGPEDADKWGFRNLDDLWQG
jgi:putative nucleotidyltransferase with HDIG domain